MLPTSKEVFIERQMKIHNDKWKVFPISQEEYIKFLEQKYEQLRKALILSYDLLVPRASLGDWHLEWFREDVNQIVETIKSSYDRPLEEIFGENKEEN